LQTKKRLSDPEKVLVFVLPGLNVSTLNVPQRPFIALLFNCHLCFLFSDILQITLNIYHLDKLMGSARESHLLEKYSFQSRLFCYKKNN